MHNYVINVFYYYNPLHVSSNSVLIIRMSNCVNTASGIVFSVSDRPMCNLHAGRSLTETGCTPDGHLQRMVAHRTVTYREWLHIGLSLTENGCTPDGHLQRLVAHRTVTYREWLHIGLSLTENGCTPGGQLQKILYQMLY